MTKSEMRASAVEGAAPAAAYVRMSTDQQELSIGTQLNAIQEYAVQHHLAIVRVYEDAAKSGLSISNRHGMKQLLRDVLDTPRAFDVVLVYDVSRWGRFQDTDAAAYYEYTCRLHGAKVVYVQEPFGCDIDPLSSLLKTLKRTMAAEYARELGLKCRAGQDQAIRLGFQMGQIPFAGLSRIAVDRNGSQRPLKRHERKAMQSERIKWVPGPQQEIDLVRRIFRMYLAPNGTIQGVALQLQAENTRSPTSHSITPAMVNSLLRCEALAGNFVWGAERYQTGKLEKKRPETRADGVLEPVVQADLWHAVQTKLWARRRMRRDKEQLLHVLRERLSENPALSTLDLEALGLHSRKAYTSAFGSVSRALELAGRDPKVFRAVHERRKVEGRKVGDRMELDICRALRGAGIGCAIHPRSRVMLLEGDIRLRLQLTWPRTHEGVQKWHVLKVGHPVSDAILLAQMSAAASAIRFLLLLPAEYRASPPWLTPNLPTTFGDITNRAELVSAVVRWIGVRGTYASR